MFFCIGNFKYLKCVLVIKIIYLKFIFGRNFVCLFVLFKICILVNSLGLLIRLKYYGN